MNATVFSYPVLIKEVYLDTFGHMNNATYLTLLEEARWDLLTKNGYGLTKIKESGLGPIILEIKLTYLKEIKLRENIVIETQLISYENKTGVLRQRMLRDQTVCCEAEFIFGLFNLKERKLVLPTTEWLRGIGIKNAD